MPGLPGWSVAAALDVIGAAGTSAAVLSISSPGVHFVDDSLEENRAARDLARHVNSPAGSSSRLCSRCRT